MVVRVTSGRLGGSCWVGGALADWEWTGVLRTRSVRLWSSRRDILDGVSGRL